MGLAEANKETKGWAGGFESLCLSSNNIRGLTSTSRSEDACFHVLVYRRSSSNRRTVGDCEVVGEVPRLAMLQRCRDLFLSLR